MNRFCVLVFTLSSVVVQAEAQFFKLRFSEEKARSAFSSQLVGNTSKPIASAYGELKKGVESVVELYNSESIIPKTLQPVFRSVDPDKDNNDNVDKFVLSDNAKKKLVDAFGNFVTTLAKVYSTGLLFKATAKKGFGCDLDVVLDSFERRVKELNEDGRLSLIQAFVNKASACKNEQEIKTYAEKNCNTVDLKIRFMEQVAAVMVEVVPVQMLRHKDAF